MTALVGVYRRSRRAFANTHRCIGTSDYFPLNALIASCASFLTSARECFSSGSMEETLLVSPRTASVRHESRMTFGLELERHATMSGTASGASISRRVLSDLMTSSGLPVFNVSHRRFTSGSVMVLSTTHAFVDEIPKGKHCL